MVPDLVNVNRTNPPETRHSITLACGETPPYGPATVWELNNVSRKNKTKRITRSRAVKLPHIRVMSISVKVFPIFYVPNWLPRRFDQKSLNLKQVYMGFLAYLAKYTQYTQRILSINHNFLAFQDTLKWLSFSTNGRCTKLRNAIITPIFQKTRTSESRWNVLSWVNELRS